MTFPGHLLTFRRPVRLDVSDRDRRILDLARRKLGTSRAEFGEAARALREATAEVIPAGRVFYLGETERGPIVGSMISGVGITEGDDGLLLVRVRRDVARDQLGRWPR